MALLRFGVLGVRIETGVLGSGVSALVAVFGLGVWRVAVLGCVRLYTPEQLTAFSRNLSNLNLRSGWTKSVDQVLFAGSVTSTSRDSH